MPKMDKHTILKSIISPDLERYAFKIAKGNDLYRDCLSELILVLGEMDEGRLIELNNNKQLVPYCCKVIYLSFNSPTSPFYKKYIKPELLSKYNKRGFVIDNYAKNFVHFYDSTDDDDNWIYLGLRSNIENIPNEDSKFTVEDLESCILNLEEEISKKRFPSEVRLFELYKELGSYRAVAKKVNIPVMTVFYIIEGFKQEIKKRI